MRKGRSRPAPRRAYREQKTHSNEHRDVSSTQRTRGVGKGARCIPWIYFASYGYRFGSLALKLSIGPFMSDFVVWRAPECPLAVEYSPAVMDEIRLEVVRAFCAFPRGGAETGGVLFGVRENGSV